MKKHLQEISDYNLARSVARQEEVENKNVFQEQVEEINNQIKNIKFLIDDLEARSRLENLEFHKIPYQGHSRKKENTTHIIIDFLAIHFGIFINEADISVSHRTINPDEKKRLGRKYIPPIYCKFVRRTLAQEIMKRSHLLNNVRNRYNDEYFVCENLTLYRKRLFDRVEKELHSYGPIFLMWRKSENLRFQKNAKF